MYEYVPPPQLSIFRRPCIYINNALHLMRITDAPKRLDLLFNDLLQSLYYSFNQILITYL